MKKAGIGLLVAVATACAHAARDNIAVAAGEAGSGGSMPAASFVLGVLGALWLGSAGLKDGNAIVGAAVGFAIGSFVGLIVSLIF